MDTHIEFKRKIDNARNILVGAVPSPAGQIDQITYALIYKFMSDIDDKTARLPNGVRQYFVGEYEKYDWHNLMRLDGQDKLNRYRDALSKMNENPHLPEIFRSIYQNAFLPYNDPKILNLFLKEIDGFLHTKSDAIGDAYEYLLSITGAQGDVGQFRTPRHIIKFIVDVVQPGKSDTVLDPACGTAGFLIAAYNYVRMQHDGLDDEGNQNGEQRLTADERKKLHGNYYGYDIDPTMVRTATVNMYLHGFSTPNIEIHDTLTSDENWNQRYDVILANPPFMTPKGGIQPHGKFGVKANRAEVLFVDYIASHLKPNGRAGIIVPEGIIFQSGTAYKELRKNLVENNLYAVVSLPSGVFNPYAGVKTSILLLDKELAAKKDEILFVKIENDGYSLGAQRRKIAGGQFPEALELIERFKNGEELQTEFAHAVHRKEIAGSGDYNLSGDRYKIAVVRTDIKYPVVDLGEIAKFINGYGFKKNDWKVSGKPIIRIQNLTGTSTEFNYTDRDDWPSQFEVKPGDLLISWSASIGFYIWKGPRAYLNQHIFNVIVDEAKILKDYLYFMKDEIIAEIKKHVHGNTMTHVTRKDFEKIKIPLPPIEIQREIVAELDGYQKIIDAAQTIIKTYKPTIKINPEWKIVTLKEITDRITDGSHNPPKASNDGDAKPMLSSKNITNGQISFTDARMLSVEDFIKEDKRTYVAPGDVLLTIVGALGRTAVVPHGTERFTLQRSVAVLKPEKNVILSAFLKAMLDTESTQKYITNNAQGVAQKGIYLKQVGEIKIPLPPNEVQQEIVTELEAEQKLIYANKKLIEIYQKKIKSKIAEVWGV